MQNKDIHKKPATSESQVAVICGATVAGGEPPADGVSLADFVGKGIQGIDGWEVGRPHAANPAKILVIDSASADTPGLDPVPKGGEPDFVILNLSDPIVKSESELFERKPDLLDLLIDRWKERLIVVVSADSLRRHQVRLTRGLAWETTIEDLAYEFSGNPVLARLREVAHILVTFDVDAVYWRSSKPRRRATAGLHAGGDATLVFDANSSEGEWRGKNKLPSLSGVAECVIASVVRSLATKGLDGLLDALCLALSSLREAGAPNKDAPQISYGDRLAAALTSNVISTSLVSVFVPVAPGGFRTRGKWSMLDQWTYHAGRSSHPRPHFEIAHALAVEGPRALTQFPVAEFGALSTVDRHEIESLRTIRHLIEDYAANKDAKKPLCLGVFGPPGAGKSFGVNEIAIAVLGIKKDDILTVNLSEFNDPGGLARVFAKIGELRNAGNEIPFIFWDEFDSADYVWLQYLLAPMQDGVFRRGDQIEPLGKCIFVFAGATSPTYQDFGPVNPLETSAVLEPEDLAEAERRWRAFVLKKGPDFKTRLAGYLNVLGPNPRQIVEVERGVKRLVDDPFDVCWPIRRALFIRGQFRLGPDSRLTIDAGVLRALLEVRRYLAGSRSLEFLCNLIKTKDLPESGLRSALPGSELLGMHVDAAKFWAIVERDREFRDRFRPAGSRPERSVQRESRHRAR